MWEARTVRDGRRMEIEMGMEGVIEWEKYGKQRRRRSSGALWGWKERRGDIRGSNA